MKAIILVAWEWSRLRPLSYTTPKPLIKIYWKSILERNMENILEHVDEYILIVKYRKELFFDNFWNSFRWKKITYIEQESHRPWSWWAIMNIWDIQWDVLIMNWDSIFEKKDLDKIFVNKSYWILVKEVNNPENYWIIKTNENWNCLEVIEKPKDYIWNLANLWVYKLNSDIFNFVNSIWLSPRWEYEITDALNIFFWKFETKPFLLESEFIDVWYPWHILEANKFFLNNYLTNNLNQNDINNQWISNIWNSTSIWKYSSFRWNIMIWENCTIENWVTIKWFCIIWDNCYIWTNSIIENSVVFDNCKIWNWCIILDSIVWNNVEILDWFINSNIGQLNNNVNTMIKWKIVNTWLKKFWCVIWDNTRIWYKVFINSWKIIESNSYIHDCNTIN